MTGRSMSRRQAGSSAPEREANQLASGALRNRTPTWSRAATRSPRASEEGTPLDAATRAYFEPRFAFDFSRVRVHHDANADAAARLLGANAFTSGSDIVFRDGAESPSLLAHELAHVVQQAGAGAPSFQLAPAANPPSVSTTFDKGANKFRVMLDGKIGVAEISPSASGAVHVRSEYDSSTDSFSISIVVTQGTKVVVNPGLVEYLKKHAKASINVTTIPLPQTPLLVPMEGGELPSIQLPSPEGIPLRNAPPTPAPSKAAAAAPSPGLWDSVGEWVHGGLDVVGIIPGVGEIADGINAAIYAAEGRWVEAGISVAAMIPIVGDAGKAGKWAVKGGKALGEELAGKALKEGAESLVETGAKKKAKKEAAQEVAVETTKNVGKHPVWLPSFSKVQVDWAHILSGHTAGGKRVLSGKTGTLFPYNWSEKKIRSAVGEAYTNSTVIKTQGERVLLEGVADGITIQLWYNKVAKFVETAYTVTK